jgi:threonine aldolase
MLQHYPTALELPLTAAEYALLFDTVYISLYKYFNAGTGGVLAGPKSVIEPVAHARKVFGGGLYQAWHYAAVALYYLDGFTERFRKAIGVADELFQRSQAHGSMRIESVPHGTNVYMLQAQGVNPEKYRAALKKDEIRIRGLAKDGGFTLVVNESLNRRSAAELAKSFLGALAATK